MSAGPVTRCPSLIITAPGVSVKPLPVVRFKNASICVCGPLASGFPPRRSAGRTHGSAWVDPTDRPQPTPGESGAPDSVTPHCTPR